MVLRDNGVNADNVSIFPESKSPLSLAFLDENNNADYIFYKDHPHDQLEFAASSSIFPWFLRGFLRHLRLRILRLCFLCELCFLIPSAEMPTISAASL